MATSFIDMVLWSILALLLMQVFVMLNMKVRMEANYMTQRRDGNILSTIYTASQSGKRKYATNQR